MSKERPLIASLFAILLLCLPAPVARALQNGDILVADRTVGLLYVDALGFQHFLTGFVNGHGVGDVATDGSGNIYVIDSAGGAVYSVDGTTGATTLVTSGGFLQFPSSVDLLPGGDLLVVEGGPSGGVVRVHPADGAQTMAASGVLDGLAVDGNGLVYVTRADGVSTWHVYRVDITSGSMVLVSNTAFNNPRMMVADVAGNLILSEPQQARISRVDPSTGSVTLVSFDNQFMAPWGVALDANAKIITADNQGAPTCNPPGPVSTCRGVVFRVDPGNGAQTIVTDQDKFDDITGVDVYHGPNVMTAARGPSWGRLKTIYR